MSIELHTDRLSSEKGVPITCDVRRHDTPARTRVVVLRGAHNAQTAYTLAYTQLRPSGWSPQVAGIDAKLQRGSLMGGTFRRDGFTVRQNRLLCLRVPIPGRALRTLLGLRRWQCAEVECYEFWADDILYGTVLEVRQPSTTELARPAYGHSGAWLRGMALPQQFVRQLDTKPSTSARLLVAKIHGYASAMRLCAKAIVASRRYL